jgi:hypothetical protein
VITFPPFKFVGDDLFVFPLFNDFGGHFCPIDRCAVRQLVAVGMHQNLANHDLLAWLGLEQIDVNRVAFRDAILPATGLYDCKCHKGIICPDQVVMLLREKPRTIPYMCALRKRKVGRLTEPIRAGLAFAGQLGSIAPTRNQQDNFAFWWMHFVMPEQIGRIAVAIFFEFLGQLACDAELATWQDLDRSGKRLCQSVW